MICAVAYDNGRVGITLAQGELEFDLERGIAAKNLGNRHVRSVSSKLYGAWIDTHASEEMYSPLDVEHFDFEDTEDFAVLKQAISKVKHVRIITNSKTVLDALDGCNISIELFCENISFLSRSDSLSSKSASSAFGRGEQREKGGEMQKFEGRETVELETRERLSCMPTENLGLDGGAVKLDLSEKIGNSSDICQKRFEKTQPRMKMGERTLKYLGVFGTAPSLFQIVDNTVTKMGSNLLRQEICSPTTDITRIRKRQNFIGKHSDRTDLNKLRSALKSLPNLDAVKSRIELLVLNSSACTMENKEKSQVANGTLDETTIARMLETDGLQSSKAAGIEEHLGCIGLVTDLLHTLMTLEELVLLELPGKTWINNLLEDSPWRKLKKVLHSTVNMSFDEIKPLIGDNRAFLITDGIDEYLELARRLYSENTKECQKLLLEITKNNPEQRICKDGMLGLCLKVSNKCSFKAGNNFGDRLKSLEEEGFIILRKRKKYGLLTTLELQVQNYKINEVFIQIMEISGGICKRLLCDNFSIFSTLDSLIEIISEVDVCLSHIAHSQQSSAVKPKISDCISIEHATNMFISKSSFQDYSLSSFLNFNFLTGQNMSGKSMYAKGLAHLIILTQLGCYVGANRSNIPIFTGIYCIETVADINDVLSVVANRRSDVLIIVDDLECSFCLQLTLAEVLLESGAIVMYITHCHSLQQYLRKYSNMNVIECSNYKVKDGLCKRSNAVEVCREILPTELYKRWMEYRKIFE